MVGRRLLGTSRELLRRVFYLSYAYRMTDDVRYLLKAKAEMVGVSMFTDWNPPHFLEEHENKFNKDNFSDCIIGNGWHHVKRIHHHLPKILSLAGHPRILLLEGEEQQIHDLIEADETWNKMHRAIIQKSTSLLGKPALERVMVGRRLLGTSRELLKRIFYLSYAYRMTENEQYLKKAEEELVAVSWFSDWNPSHFLDVAEMTMGVAIGYDWLYEDLSDLNREVIKSAILMKGINPSKENASHNWWLTSDNNWNQVCNAGMVYGALAIQEDYPDLAEEIIDRAFQSIPIPMEAYQPDGVYPEGYGYWGYGTTFNVLFLSAIEKYLGTDRGLTSTPGFLESGDFLKHMLTPTGKSFSWADCRNRNQPENGHVLDCRPHQQSFSIVVGKEIFGAIQFFIIYRDQGIACNHDLGKGYPTVQNH